MQEKMQKKMQKNDCGECIDGRFHQVVDDYICNSFVRENQRVIYEQSYTESVDIFN